jgi:putative iron-only hydrogenase system regulator
MENRVAMIGLIVGRRDSVRQLNALLQEYGEYIIGRMGIPYHKREVSVISIVLDAPQDVISALSGKLGMLPHVSTKTIYAKFPES